jgi:lipid II:glycine glycyltransferase (peptidoglycan interpeptide bridge formation enzyme)
LVARAIDLKDFDKLIAGFDGAVQEMTVTFAQSRWPGVTLEPWIYEQDDKAAAAALVMVQSIPMKLGKLAIVKWGPILADENASDAAAIQDAAIAHLADEYGSRRGMMISIMARAEPRPIARVPQSLSARGFSKGSSLPFPERYFVNVRITDEEQRKSFVQKWRYHLNKSEKEGLQFEVAPASDLPRFCKLYSAMTARKKFPDYSAYKTLPHLFSHYPDALKPQLFFVTKDGEDVAGAVIFTAGKTAIYLYGATSDTALPLRAGYLMHARIISWLRDNTQADWYDLGGNDGFSGLHQFKKGMVGQAGVITAIPPIAHFAARLAPRLTGYLAYRLREAAVAAIVFVNRQRGAQSKPDMKAGEQAP